MLHGGIEVARADGLGDGMLVEEAHQSRETWLGCLGGHVAEFDGADGVVCGGLVRGGKGVDVLEDVRLGGNVEMVAHLGEHCVLGFAVLQCLSELSCFVLDDG